MSFRSPSTRFAFRRPPTALRFATWSLQHEIDWVHTDTVCQLTFISNRGTFRPILIARKRASWRLRCGSRPRFAAQFGLKEHRRGYMGHLATVEQLGRRGRFSEAHQLLDRSPFPSQERLAVDAVRAELLERTGRYSASKALAEQVLRNPRCLPNQRCSSQMALAYCAFEHGFIDTSMSHFQKALSAAEVAKDLRATCICQLRVMNLLADRSGYLAI